ncbi:MAG: hypothetical protein HLUCCA11_00160 [Phormidesmis priestleyi Ana]|uniref:DUF4405 domain-containing protein n=1 Tax=Phormidesmis priestleyi Ana TaxID=1666911 RepID=A0A0P8A3C2_9CYAN|nr:MAG: hypothetical protein HLUCCA11_00160 [Phormidesmis priestleyi Ana]
MSRKQLLKVINIGLGILFLDMAVTGLFPDLVSHDIFHIVHEKAGKVFVFFAIAHLALNWNWVKLTLLKKKKKA